MKPKTKKTLHILGIVLAFALIVMAALLFVPENIGFFRP